ncbi:unnamed protein product [Arabidopsis thaliana]|uniref:F-box/kelch-repeat protein At3g18720 n=5 Tax=Arabidopsis TaxID=3701 RepID=FBK62_ARATH|nr:F-box family protein [Arabidopsis thaliana]Q9LSA5.1 RecName: Full=F-box/kelch-repeat protein At3g18720 [Arabidopsis thaliana]KAG7625738.1 Galactose oxidase/kelch beta-propeller [Arabidopsis thaliana x Arabidopsis arenosa]KAG7631745.1 Galactose oxidase/kelch beta-propeller [Arabidopsis suecica]ABE65947.1 F-box family protein [Arabidopsis thaliana]AEE76136.1 F-box family protein [Arabidopsis thaliana]OAP05441.1 hypothetical protein AXX17_AT3G19880 [Arabidopsis thaliana]|eukprot:NP_566617.1 F-box family protein [Arabidopsis thaliana]
MRTRRQTYPPIAESLTARSIVQALPASATISGNGGPKKKKNCVNRGLWDKQIPTDLLQEILSRLGLKANIHASLVCKTWLKEAVSVRKFQSRPWLFYPQSQRGGPKEGDYVLFNPSRSQTHHLKFPELTGYRNKLACAKDGWLLVVKDNPDVVFFLNPFTGERICLPQVPQNSTRDCLTFSAAPTSTSCCVISFTPQSFLYAVVKVDTWRPGESVWTTHHFDQKRYGEVINRCIFSNGMFYCLSTSGRLSVFDPSRETWNVLPVKPCRAFRRKIMLVRQVFMTEHEGDIFVVTTRRVNNRKLLAFKLNLQGNVWEEMKVPNGLTVFSSDATSLTRAGLPEEERNILYSSDIDDFVKSSHPTFYYYDCSAWLQPPHDNFNF